MSGCNLDYIPDRLHWNDKPILTQYAVGDTIYRRSKPDELDNPFKSISLTDLSHNIGVNCGIKISEEADVLFSIIESESVEVYSDKLPCTLEIKSLDSNNIYCKLFGPILNKENISYLAVMELIHKPVGCMYPHCVFRIIMNDTEVTFKNYKETLGDKGRELQQLRTMIRDELSSMIRRRAIEQFSE